MLLKNNTGSTSRVGLTAKVDPNNPKAFIYATAGESNIIGIVGQEVPKYEMCEIITSGTARVMVAENVVQGATIRAAKIGDNISRGVCKAAKSTDTSYFKIGTSLEGGKGLVRCSLGLSYNGTTGAIADGTYTVGLGVSTDGVIVVKDGVIISLTQAT